MRIHKKVAAPLTLGVAAVLGLGAWPVDAFYLRVDVPLCRVNGVTVPGACGEYVASRVLGESTEQPPAFQGTPPPPPMGEPGQPGMVPPQGMLGEFGQPGMPPEGQPGYYPPRPDGQMEPSRPGGEPNRDDGRQVRSMQMGMRQMESGLKKFEQMIKVAEQKGTAVPQELKDKLNRAKEVIAVAGSASSVDELQGVDVEELQGIMRSLEESRGELFEKAQRLDGMKRGMRDLERGLKFFESQVKKLERQKVTVPAEVKDKLATVRGLVAKVKAAKSYDEIEGTDLESLPELMQSLDESRQSLEMLARWPQTQRQASRTLAELTRTLKRSKTVAIRLEKKGIDVGSLIAQLEADVTKLRATYDEAAAKVKAGDAEEAFQLLENDFFEQVNDVMESSRRIETMANFGQFTSQFRRGLAEAQRTIKQLKKQKVDVSGLEDLVKQMQAQGAEVQALLKAKPFDAEVVLIALEDLGNLRQSFEEVAGESGDGGEAMPWEQGPEVFKPIQMPSSMQMYVPRRAGPSSLVDEPPSVGESNPSPAP